MWLHITWLIFNEGKGKYPKSRIISGVRELVPRFLKITFIGVWLIYNVVSVSRVQQSESVTHPRISTLLLDSFPI